MRLRSVVLGLVLSVATAAPCLAQNLDVRGGGRVKVEIVHVDAAVEEGVANVVVDETFRNTTDAVQEGVYRFKLPEDAVIGAFSMWMEGKEKQGRVLDARQARQVYDSIVRKRRDPGLLEQIGWREFRVNVFPIPAHDVVRVRLSYAHVVRDDLGLETLEIALPQGCGVVGDLRVHADVKAARGLAGLDCPSHKSARIVSDANCAMADWNGDGVEPTGPFVLRSIPRRDGFDVSLLAHRPAGAQDGWFVARVVPRLASPPNIARDVVFVIDRSGSMEGKKMDQARAALIAGLDTLKPGDRFDVVSFSTDVTAMRPERLLDATPENLAAARRMAVDMTASGGTNIDGALTAALALRDVDPSRLFAVVFLTDGDPTVGETNPDRILASWRTKSAGTARLFAFGVGDDVKDFLLTKLAVEGRGEARYVRLDENLEVKLGALFDRVRTPLLLDPSIELTSETVDGVQALDREPQRLPDLFQGGALVVSGRYKGAGKAVLHLRGRSGESGVSLDVPVELPAETPSRPHVAQIWAKARVERLLDDMRVLGANAELREEVRRLGLTHQLVTPFTSFLVVEDGVHIPDPGETARLPGGAQQTGPVNPNDVVVPDAQVGEFNPDPEGLVGAGGGTSIGDGSVGHVGTGAPSAFLSRRAGAGGRGGGGLGQGGGGGAGGGVTKQSEGAVMWALRWLQNHQSPDGRWDAAGFGDLCKLDRCAGAGDAADNVATTGLSLLCFLGAGETHQSGTCRETVRSGLKFLRDVQDSEGCYGPRTSPRFLRNHAVAALATVEAYGMTGSRVFKEPAQRGIAFALATRAASGGWRRAAPDDGDLDVETTAWMLMLLKSAATSQLDVDRQAIADVVAEFEKLTDPATGVVAAKPGGPSVEACTAIGLLARIFGGRTPKDDAAILRAADALAAKLPKPGEKAQAIDGLAFHFATLAMFQLGQDHWKKWNESMTRSFLSGQRMETDRDERGSFDPVGVGVGAADGGRIWSTALACLDMEVYYRYGLVLGVREDTTKPPTSNPPADGK